MSSKELSIGKKLILILPFSCGLVALGIINGFFLGSLLQLFCEATGIVEEQTEDLGLAIAFYGVITLIVATVTFIPFGFLLVDYKSKNKKTARWYLDKVLLSLMVVGIAGALVIITAFGPGETLYMFIGMAMLPFMGLTVIPNAIRYALKDMKSWKSIFYGKGNLERFKKSKDYYKTRVPVPFEKKLVLAVIKEQFLNLIVVIGVMLIFAAIGIFAVTHDSSEASGGLIGAVVHVKAERAAGTLFFLMIGIVTFAPPILAYYITNAVYKLRVIKRREYIAYHAIVSSVKDNVVLIDSDGRHYKYDYCTCVGIRQKDVHDTPATLIFIPDDVLLIPDKKE